VRECFVARPGHVLISCDYSAAELHTLAQVCLDLFGHSKLADMLNSGLDVHLAVGAQIAGIDYPEALALRKAGDKEIGEMRQLAKAANFGFPGGCGPTRFVDLAKGYGLDMSVADATELKRNWLDALPEIAEFFAYVARTEGDSGLCRVQHLRVARVRGQASYCAACNSYFQGLASDGAKSALWRVVREQHLGTLRGSYAVAFIHDEILLEAPEADAPEVALELQQIMVEAFNEFCPDVPTTAEPAIMRAWSKSAEPVFDAAGRLKVWTP